MFRQRVVDDIYVFTSEMYVQVTAGAILTEEGTVVIDTLPFPEESRAMCDFLREHSPLGIQFVINTHYHADHVYGNYLYPEADIISWRDTRSYLERHGEGNLLQAQDETPELADVELRLPNVVFDKGRLLLHLGNRTLELIHAPGHTDDSIVVYSHEDRLLFAGDTMMPVPYVVWGDWRALSLTLSRVAEMRLDNIVQGHGEVLLRGEIPATIKGSIDYLHGIYQRVTDHVELDGGRDELKSWDLESFGLSRLPLSGLAPQLHRANLLALYDQISRSRTAPSGN